MIKRTLYFGNPAYLHLKNSQLVYHVPNDDTVADRTFPVEDLGIVILDHKQITITQGLLESLLNNNCAVITCGTSRMPIGLFMPLDGHSLQSERFQAQVNSSKPLRKQLWQQTVQAKITNQAFALKMCVPDCVTDNMMAWVNEVRSDDAYNLEGRAAAYYWQNFFPKISSFKRHRYGDYPNNLLNYGYAILRSVVARALVGSGLLPTLGIHHHNKYNAYCLADDIMEPYRPWVDVLVHEIITSSNTEIDEEDLSPELKRRLLSIPTLDVYIMNKKRPLMIAAEITTASLARCYTGEARQIIYPRFEQSGKKLLFW